MPADWKVLALEECMAAVIDYRGKTPAKRSYGIPLITAKVVKGGRIETPDEFIAEQDYEAWMRRGIPAAGDVLVTTEAPLGEVAQLGTERVALAQRLVALRGRPDVLDNNFLKFLLQSREVQNQLRSRASGTTVLGIKQSELRRISLTLPPIAEQHAIAHILGTLDHKIELIRRMNETREAMARALFKSWFVGFDPVRAKGEGRDPGLPRHLADLFPDSFEDSELGDIPRGWRVATVHELAEINASTLSTTDALGVIDYIEISEVMRGEIGRVPRYKRGAEPSRARRRLKHGDTVVSTVRPDRGAHFLCMNPAETLIASTGFAVLSPRDGNWALLYCALTRPEVGEELGRLADGGAYPAIRPEAIASLTLAVPPTADLPLSFQKLAAPLLGRTNEGMSEARTLTALRDTLLPKLVSGELRVKGAERVFQAGPA